VTDIPSQDGSADLKVESPLVSIVVPTRNSELHLNQCLASIQDQTYSNIELIVIDNHSSDATTEIAHRYSDKVLTAGPERSAQVNIGSRSASGEFVYRVDSDFVLDRNVVSECIDLVRHGADAVVVHNSPDESAGFLSKIRRFETDMYKYDLTHSSARFVRLSVYLSIGGLDENLTAGEDYDFQNRLSRSGAAIAFADAEAIHLGEPKSLWRLLKKYYWYGGEFRRFRSKNSSESREQLAFFRSVYFAHWKQFLNHPLLGASFLFYHGAKFAAGGLGYLTSGFRNH
jgi:glycosyltransferase involved in cell wall biosynthesis